MQASLMLSNNAIQVKFCQSWAEQVLTMYPPLRRRSPVSLCIVRSQATNSSDLCTPANARVARLTEHELVDMSLAARAIAAKKKGPTRATRKLPLHQGVCAYVGCPAASKDYKGPLPKRSLNFCQSCNEGRGSYYHQQCFFAVHRCVVSKH